MVDPYENLKIKRSTKDKLYDIKKPRQTFSSLLEEMMEKEKPKEVKRLKKDKDAFWGKI